MIGISLPHLFHLSILLLVLQSAKMHLTEATKNIKMDNSQVALMQINMTRQAITLAGLTLNATIICNNVRNEGYCVAP
jgi:hypothetical protein